MRYAIPRKNREFASWPAIAELPSLVARNVELKSAYAFSILDLPFGEYARLCRAAVAKAAARFAADIGIAPGAIGRAPVIATGHQPELFHAGVWIKNFLAFRLAQLLGGSSVNLIVDNDIPKHLGLVAPVREDSTARQVEISFARKAAEHAFEEYPPLIEGADAFVGAVSQAATRAPFHEAAVDLARRLAAASGRGANIGDVLAAVRLSYERELSIANSEVPTSRLADEGAFGAFAISILQDALRFASAYNGSLAQYRRAHHIRSRVNPMPDLVVDSTRVEAPFWIWHSGESRRRLYAAQAGDEVVLYAGEQEVYRLREAGYSDAEAAWKALVAVGLKIRPRAITTTLFMRLFVADLFIHGVGGAEYDEVADGVVHTFYGVEPPAFATITATLIVQWGIEEPTTRPASALKRTLRDIRYNPQIFLDDRPSAPADVRQLVADKWRLVAFAPTDRRARQEKWERIREINGRLSGRLATLEQDTSYELARAEERRAADSVLLSRDYSVFLTGAREAARFYDDALSGLRQTART